MSESRRPRSSQNKERTARFGRLARSLFPLLHRPPQTECQTTRASAPVNHRRSPSLFMQLFEPDLASRASRRVAPSPLVMNIHMRSTSLFLSMHYRYVYSTMKIKMSSRYRNCSTNRASTHTVIARYIVIVKFIETLRPIFDKCFFPFI